MASKTNWWPCCVSVILLAVVLGLAAVHWQKQSEFNTFMEEHGLMQHGSTFSNAGINYLEQFASPSLLEHKAFKEISQAERNKIYGVSEKLASSLLLLQWLESRQLQHHHGDVQIWLDEHKQQEHHWSVKFGYAGVRQLAMLTQEETTTLVTYLKTTEFETYLLREGIKELAGDDNWKRLILNPTFSSLQKMKEFFIFDDPVVFR